jgi:hypothetical protein
MRWSPRVATLVAAVAFVGHSLHAQQSAQQRSIDSLAAAVRQLQARLDSASRATGVALAPAAPRPGAYMNVSFVGLVDMGWSTARDIPSLQPGDHDPRANGFTLPNAELVLDGAVDPYFKGFLNVVHKIDPAGETGVELEEMYLLTSALPANLQLKVGQFFAEFGRQNPQHPHAWAFADQPLVLNRMFGGEGLRGQGARLSWLLPTGFYAEAMLGVMNSGGETMSSFRSEESDAIHGGVPFERDVQNAGDLVYTPRIAASFDLTENQVLLVGASGAFGPNSAGETTRTSILGTDVYWKWKSPTAAQGFPFFAVQAEYLTRSYQTKFLPNVGETSTAPTDGRTLKDNGSYAQLLWGIKPRLVAALRYDDSNTSDQDFVTSEREPRTRITPSLTWYPSEYSKIRVQYNHDTRHFGGAVQRDHSLWMQFEFLLGAHAPHKF